MIRLLLGLTGSLCLALLAEPLEPGTFTPRPWSWGVVIFVFPPLAALLANRGWKAGTSRRADRAPPWHILVLLAHGAVLFPLGWGNWVLDDLAWRGSPARAFPLLLAPAAALALWLSPWIHASEKQRLEMRGGARHEGEGSDGGDRDRRAQIERYAPWLAARARLVLVPALAFLAVRTAARSLEAMPGLEHAPAAYPSVPLAFLVLAAVAAFAASPWLFKLSWPSSPFPQGALREQLVQVLRSTSARLGGLRVWRASASRAVNAWTVGVLPGTCHVFFTRGGLERLEPDEIAAIFSHELAHVRRHHLAYQMFVAVAFLLLVRPAISLTAGLPAWAQGGLLALFGLGGLRLCLGWCSRWLEVEADVLGAQAAGTDRYLKALRRSRGPSSCTAPSARCSAAATGDWRHFSMEERASLVEESARDACRLEAILARCRWIRRGAILFFVGAIAAFSALAAGELLASKEAVAWRVARAALVRAGELRPLLLDRPVAGTPPESGPLGWLARSRQSIETEYRHHLETARRALAEVAPGLEPATTARDELSRQLESLLRELREKIEASSLKSP